MTDAGIEFVRANKFSPDEVKSEISALACWAGSEDESELPLEHRGISIHAAWEDLIDLSAAMEMENKRLLSL